MGYRRMGSVAVAVALTAGGLAAVPVSGYATGSPVRVLHGNQPQVNAVFPNDRFTVPDPREVTGRRVNMPLPRHSTSANPSLSASPRLINPLDGFDIQPPVY